MAVFTNNFVRNPAFQLGLQDYSSTQGATIQLDKSNVKYGTQSCYVKCPGNKAGEGVITAGGIIPSNSVCSASLYIMGTGDVTIYAAVNPGGTIVASVPVTCTGQWQRFALEEIQCSPGQTLFLMCQTNKAQECAFWITGIQCEDSSPHHPYCDGDQDGCEWLEGFWGGRSRCHFPNPVVANSNALGTPDLVNVLATGQRFFIDSSSVASAFDDLVNVSGPGPIAAIKDFGVAQLTDPDPAQTYVSWNTAGTTSTTGGAYTRNWGVFYPPVDYPVSNGSNLWNRAAFMSAGWLFSSVPNNGTVNLSRVQVEALPVTTAYSQPSPTTFDPPRAIHSVIRPDRLNYITNPSIEVNTTGWSAVGTATLSQDGTVSVGQIIEFDDNLLTAGTKSLKVTLNANGDGAQINIPNLITGTTYIASAYVQAGAGLENIVMFVANGTSSVLSTGGTGYGGPPEYGSGSYGGVNPTSDLPLSTWFRINCIFTATADSHILQITNAAGLDVAYPTSMWIDAVLVEAGEVLSYYFDGSFGNNFSWEGTAGLSRSYYYDQQNLKKNAVLNVLEGHVPLGIEFDTPQYNTPPIA